MWYKLLSFALFADDSNIFYSNNCLKAINKVVKTEINKVTEWPNVNKLKRNLFCSDVSIKKPMHDVEYTINSINFDQVKSTNILGIIIDEV